VVIGTVKTLAPLYGIDVLIQAFAHVCEQLKQDGISKSLKLRIVGGGPDADMLLDLARRLGISDQVDFVGRVDHAQVPEELKMLDIYVALSRRESFGVAVVEACACGVPVVVSDVGGLPEVVRDGITGFVVPSEDYVAAAAVLRRLVDNDDLRHQIGRAARAHVERLYDWNQSIQMMIDCYRRVLPT
jgi:glycosyltransferase involved in cell wall biosynthesis